MKKKEAAPEAPKKPKKQKAPKAPKAPKQKKSKKVKAESSEKKGIPKILFIILPVVLLLAVATVVVYLVFFRTPSVEEEMDKIVSKTATYQVGSDEIVSLESVVDEGVVTRSSVETPILDENSELTDLTEFTYHYREVNGTPSRLAADYVDVLLGEEQGFIFVDQEYHELEERPDMKADVGSVFLAKVSADTVAAPEEGGEEDGKKDEGLEPVDKLAEVAVAWSDSGASLAIRVSQVEGVILPPVVEPDPSEIEREPLALKAQLEYFNNLDPSKLGLPGDFMSEYRVYPVDGLVRVSGEPCRVFNVYLMDLPAETNTFMGTFYLSTDNQKVFKLDETGTIVSVDMS